MQRFISTVGLNTPDQTCQVQHIRENVDAKTLAKSNL